MKTLSLSLALSLSYNYYSLVLICERFMVFRVYLFQGILIVLNRFLIFWKKKSMNTRVRTTLQAMKAPLNLDKVSVFSFVF